MVPKYTVEATIDNLTKDELDEWKGDLTITDSYLTPPETLEEMLAAIDPNWVEKLQRLRARRPQP